ncbi:MAG: hypothetical protein QOF85_1203 [Solirubrobacterales bacterium]|nr:hypothetical protein [Solirubrobacterales bacterium]
MLPAASQLRQYFEQDRLGRLLLLLHDEFGEDTSLTRADFLDWRNDPAIASALTHCLTGASADLDLLASAIETRFSAVDEARRHAVAADIAATAKRFAPLTAQELSQATTYLGNRIDASAVETRNDITQTLERLFAAHTPVAQPERPGEALLRGPLEQAGARKLVEAARAAADADPSRAAGLFLEACDRLDEHALGVVAEGYRQRAAQLLIAAGESKRGVELLADVAGARLERGSELARSTLHDLDRDDLPKPAWLDAWLGAKLDWPLDPDGYADALLEAIDEHEPPRAVLVDAVDLLLLLGRFEDVADLVEPLSADVAELDYRLDLGLAEARSRLGSPMAEDLWSRLLDRSGGEPLIAGIVWQRRGLCLAESDRVDEALAAYRNAMRAWSEARQGDEQLAEAFYCLQAVSLNAGRDPIDYELWPLAAEMRGDAEMPVARAERLEHRAMKQRLKGELRQALYTNSRALLIHRRSGSIQGVMSVRERLGELYGQAGEPISSLQSYALAGKGKEAREMAPQCDRDELEQVLDLDGPSWQRAAEYRVIAEVGEQLSPELVGRLLPIMRGDLLRVATAPFALDVSAAARHALCVVSLKLAADKRDVAIEVMREELEHAPLENMQAASRALMLGTDLGLWEQTPLLIEAYLEDSAASGVESGWIAKRALLDPAAVRQLREAALEGSKAALLALAIAEHLSEDAAIVSDDPQLCRLCTEWLASVGNLSGIHRNKGEGGRPSMSVGWGRNFFQLGIVARFAEKMPRRELVEQLLAVTDSAEEPESNRARAVEALTNVSTALDRTEITELIGKLRPLAAGEHPTSRWDQNEDHPFSAVRVLFHRPGELRGEALNFLGVVGQRFPDLASDWLPELIDAALQQKDHSTLLGALSASARLPELRRLPLIAPHLDASRAPLRVGALRAWAASGEALPERGLALAQDSAPVVRMALAEIAPELPEPQRSEVLAELAHDPDLVIAAEAQGERSSQATVAETAVRA